MAILPVLPLEVQGIYTFSHFSGSPIVHTPDALPWSVFLLHKQSVSTCKNPMQKVWFFFIEVGTKY